MIKIEFEVPEWVIGRHIHIFAGTELLGNKECRIVHENGKHVAKYLPLKIKQENGRCNRCGVCCGTSKFPERLIEKILRAIHEKEECDPESERCEFLGETGCILGAWIPFSCARSICTAYEGCTEKLEEIE